MPAYADSVSREILSVDVMRHGAGASYAASTVARVSVRYTYPDAPDEVTRFIFSSQADMPGRVFMRNTSGRFGLVDVDDPARFGSFGVDPVSWVHRFYGLEG